MPSSWLSFDFFNQQRFPFTGKLVQLHGTSYSGNKPMSYLANGRHTRGFTERHWALGLAEQRIKNWQGTKQHITIQGHINYREGTGNRRSEDLNLV
jgi:hypothetical protein